MHFKGLNTEALMLFFPCLLKAEHALYSLSLGEELALVRFMDQSRAQLADLVTLSSTCLTAAERVRVSNLILQDAHNLSTAQKLVQGGIESTEDFRWSSLIHFYVKKQDVQSKHKAEVFCKLQGITLSYDFEYSGDGERIVITPLTEKVFFSTALALRLYRGVVVTGPDSGGKKDTLKALSLALGKHFITVLCDESLHMECMESFVSGVASCEGCWGLFIGIQKLSAEVNSLLTFLTHSVNSTREIGGGTDQRTIDIGGNRVSASPNCAFLGTLTLTVPMTLGGPLMSSSKLAFRPISIMAPDIALICEHILLSNGFETPKHLSLLIASFFCNVPNGLVEERASNWTVALIKPLLIAMGSLRRHDSYAAIDDTSITLRVLRDYGCTRIRPSMQESFRQLLFAHFLNLDIARAYDERFGDHITVACDEGGLWADQTFVRYVQQLDEAFDLRRAVIITGPPAASKTSIWRTLLRAQAKRDGRSVPHSVEVFFPALLSMEIFYGFFDSSIGTWIDGHLVDTLRKLTGKKGQGNVFLAFDGMVDIFWVERLVSLLKDDPFLLLPTMERLLLSESVNLIFETSSLHRASPAFVCACGVLTVSIQSGQQRSNILGIWVRTRPHGLFDLKSKASLSPSFL